MYVFPAASASITPRPRLGGDGKIYVDLHPHGTMVMTGAEALEFMESLGKIIKPIPVPTERRRRSDPKVANDSLPHAIFARREVPETRTDFDKDDDATGV